MKGFFAVVAGIVILQLSCSDSKIVFPDTPLTGTVSGSISPKNMFTKLYLIDITTVDSVFSDTTTGIFTFKKIPEGTYLLRAIAPGCAIVEKYVSVRQFTSTGQILMSPYPQLFQSSSPADSAHIDSLALIKTYNPGDSVYDFKINFREYMDTLSLAREITIFPDLKFTVRHTGSSMILRFPIREFFSCPKITIIIGSDARTNYNHEPMGDSLLLTIFPDTTIQSMLANISILKSKNSYISDSGFFPLTFLSEMDQNSVEESFKAPAGYTPIFEWGTFDGREQTVKIRLYPQPDRTFLYLNATLNSGYHTVDSGFVGPKENISIMVYRYRILVNPTIFKSAENEIIKLITNFIPENQSLREAISITPAVNNIYMERIKDSVFIYHSNFSAGAQCTLTVDSTVKIYGTNQTNNQRISIPFSVENEVHSDLFQNSTITTSTPDTTATIPTQKPFNIYFPGTVNRGLIEQHITIEPSILFTTSWSDTVSDKNPALKRSILTIYPSQPLMSNTIYTVTIDSGSLGEGWMNMKDINLIFKTSPLRWISSIPFTGQITVPLDVPFNFVFNTILDSSTIVSSLKSTPEIPDLKLSSWSPSDSSFTLTHSELEPSTIYTLFFEGITDMYGNPCLRKDTITFTTAAQ